MKYLIVSDIFGRTSALEKFAQSVKGLAACQIISPYDNIQFSSETEAYCYFNQNVGLESYYQALKARIKEIKQPFKLIGFSVGASICWQYIASCTNPYLVKSELFYGSQIRNMHMLSPLSPVRLILPKFEPHFSIDEHILALKEKSDISIERSECLHGFMNQLSTNFDFKAYQYYVSVLSKKHLR